MIWYVTGLPYDLVYETGLAPKEGLSSQCLNHGASVEKSGLGMLRVVWAARF